MSYKNLFGGTALALLLSQVVSAANVTPGQSTMGGHPYGTQVPNYTNTTNPAAVQGANATTAGSNTATLTGVLNSISSNHVALAVVVVVIIAICVGAYYYLRVMKKKS